MRKVVNLQRGLFDQSKYDFEISLDSRDEIPKLLIGLQRIILTPELREDVFEILIETLPDDIRRDFGREGMSCWKIFVLGTLRLNCNWDYDKTVEMANEHNSIRRMLGHDKDDFENKYPAQTVKDNVRLLKPEILDRINQVVCKYGHELIGKEAEELRGSCDSFVVETDVHFPTDINLLFDAMVKVIIIISTICEYLGITEWRQHEYNIKKLKQLFTRARKLKHSTSKNPEKREEKNQVIEEAYEAYLDLADSFIAKVLLTIAQIETAGTDIFIEGRLMLLNIFITHARRQIDQVRRRVIDGEKIPHDEKVFSIFEEHTEWICKGKAGVPQELGLRVCILKDQFGFVLHHHIMEKQTDDKIAIPMVTEAKIMFASLIGCSFDKGFYTPDNKEKLKEILEHTVLPKKGKLSGVDKEEEHSEEFLQARRKHSAVESAINALENHGLDRCRDHGIDGFKRYVALAVLARNIQILGHMIQQEELKRRQLRKRV
jgi:hypothetical protein